MSVKNSYHWRNNSGELDVFEAAHYFSGAGEIPGQRASRMSLDMPLIRHPINSNNIAKQLNENKKQFKQPSSPGGKLASFLNSLFNQTSSKKKKKSKPGTTNLEQESPGGRKRRSSISHFSITATYSNTPTNCDDQEFRFKNVNIFKNGSFRDCSENGFRKFGDADDGADTDSSSDLFDLPNHDLDFYSSGLPVYGTTNMDRIRIGATISSAATL